MALINAMLSPLRLPPRDGAVLGFGSRLGLTVVDGILAVSSDAQYLCSCLNRVVEDVLRVCALKATWTSLQVNVNTTAEMHKDIGCRGTSLILLTGEFCRGAFHCGPLLLDAAGQILAFDGRVPHCSDEFGGKRISLVFHTLETYEQTGADLLAQLQGMGFPLPSQAPLLKRVPERLLRFLYLFAGPERRSSIAHFCMR